MRLAAVGSTLMDTFDLLGALLAATLLPYLLAALLFPENFS